VNTNIIKRDLPTNELITTVKSFLGPTLAEVLKLNQSIIEQENVEWRDRNPFKSGTNFVKLFSSEIVSQPELNFHPSLLFAGKALASGSLRTPL
jgi:hypothetical protein